VIKLETPKAIPPAQRAESLLGFRLFPRPLTYWTFDYFFCDTAKHSLNELFNEVVKSPVRKNKATQWMGGIVSVL
jgi:hypothetical protein